MLASTTAEAFEVETALSNPCHEEMSMEAADAAKFPAFASAPAATEDQRRAMDDLIFTLPHRDVWTLAYLIGVRSNDLKDRAPSDISSLILIHDDPAGQDAHCIRREVDDGAAGDVGALGACRAFILRELEAGGLLDDELDLATNEPVSTYLKFRGRITIALPRFAYHLGRAIHAVEDGYSHAMRNPDTGNVRHVLNWIDAFGKSGAYEESRDGYPHLSSVDDCRRSDTVQVARLEHARGAASAILAAIAAPGAARRVRVEAAVDAALVLEPGCTIDNQYCNAPELEEPTDVRSFGCATGGGGLAMIVVAGIVFILVRSRRRRAPLALCVLLAARSVVHAQPADPQASATSATAGESTSPEEAAPPKDLPAKVQDTSDVLRWHFDARGGASWDDPGASIAAGIGVDYKRWTFGLLGEWNPWFSLDDVGSSRVGVANLFGTAAFRWYHSSKIAMATRIEVGSSTMLFELVGIDKFTTGIYLGGTLTTVRFPLGPNASLTFDPIHFALPAPRPFGLPFYYKQYRVTVG
ncbi:MAG TPA: hypothetical protein VIV40_16635, partial [Kofleriaceae bacterium]